MMQSANHLTKNSMPNIKRTYRKDTKMIEIKTNGQNKTTIYCKGQQKPEVVKLNLKSIRLYNVISKSFNKKCHMSCWYLKGIYP